MPHGEFWCSGSTPVAGAAGRRNTCTCRRMPAALRSVPWCCVAPMPAHTVVRKEFHSMTVDRTRGALEAGRTRGPAVTDWRHG